MYQFGRVAPTIPVSDFETSSRFYCDTLGFSVRFTNGVPVSFAVIVQGDAELHLKLLPDKAGTSHMHLMIDDLDELFARIKNAEVKILQPPKVQEWGLRDIVIADPDGNTTEIAECVD